VTDRNEDLFHGNLAPAIMDDPDPLNETLEGYCLCDGSEQCGRKATSDTRADSSEPQNNVRLAVPRTPTLKRRKKRQASSTGEEVQTGGNRTYPSDYRYELADTK